MLTENLKKKMISVANNSAASGGIARAGAGATTKARKHRHRMVVVKKKCQKRINKLEGVLCRLKERQSMQVFKIAKFQDMGGKEDRVLKIQERLNNTDERIRNVEQRLVNNRHRVRALQTKLMQQQQRASVGAGAASSQEEENQDTDATTTTAEDVTVVNMSNEKSLKEMKDEVKMFRKAMKNIRLKKSYDVISIQIIIHFQIWKQT